MLFSHCVLCGWVGIGVVRHTYRLAQILRARATRSQVSSRSVTTESDGMSEFSTVAGDVEQGIVEERRVR